MPSQVHFLFNTDKIQIKLIICSDFIYYKELYFQNWIFQVTAFTALFEFWFNIEKTLRGKNSK